MINQQGKKGHILQFGTHISSPLGHIKFIVILMFSEELNFVKKPFDTGGTSYRQPALPPHPSQADLQYEICSTLLKHTGHKFSIKEADLMENSRKFLETFSSFRKKGIDSSRTLDTLMDEGREHSLAQEQEQNFALLRPKSPTYGSRKNGLVIGQQLSEIEQRCSYSCFVFVSNLVAEYKKQESKLKYYQSRDLCSLKREEQNERLEQQNLILRKKLEYQQEAVLELEKEVQRLKEKNRSINSCVNDQIHSLNHSQKYFEINSKVYKDIKAYLTEKEAILQQQTHKITETQNQVLKSIEVAFDGSTCQKCCQILRKLKQSIMKIRKYLEGESVEFQRLYDKYKKTMYSIKSRPSI